MTNKKIASEIAIGIILFVAVVIGVLFWMQGKSVSKIQNEAGNKTVIQKPIQKEKETVMCTQDAKLCDDGKTYVLRTGPNCEFSPCPSGGVVDISALCKREYISKVLRCGKYFRAIPSQYILDAADGIYNQKNELIGICGGMPGPDGSNNSPLCSEICEQEDLCKNIK